MMLAQNTSVCYRTDMEENTLPDMAVSLDEYRAQIDNCGTELAAARRRVELTAHVLRLRVLRAIAAGMTESEAARLAGVRRQTVRDWAGK